MTNLQASLLAAFAILVAILIWHAFTRDKNVRRTRWGVFIERDRFEEEDKVHLALWNQDAEQSNVNVSMDADEKSTTPKWPTVR